MTAITVEEAQARLPQLIQQLQPGEEVALTQAGQTVARLVGAPKPVRPPRRLGTLKGTVLGIAPDFDAPLDDFQEYME
jgi:antitoxin (DNA-binding transcriptional repressor) of toxin-antitoxin stability system